jgi:hypothetical protein
MNRNPTRFFFLAAAILLAAFGFALWQWTSLHPGWIYLTAASDPKLLLTPSISTDATIPTLSSIHAATIVT